MGIGADLFSERVEVRSIEALSLSVRLGGRMTFGSTMPTNTDPAHEFFRRENSFDSRQIDVGRKWYVNATPWCNPIIYADLF